MLANLNSLTLEQGNQNLGLEVERISIIIMLLMCGFKFCKHRPNFMYAWRVRA